MITRRTFVGRPISCWTSSDRLVSKMNAVVTESPQQSETQYNVAVVVGLVRVVVHPLTLSRRRRMLWPRRGIACPVRYSIPCPQLYSFVLVIL